MAKICLDKLKTVAEIALIIATIIYGYVLTDALKNKEINLENLKLAVSVLIKEPTAEEEPLRVWAIEAFDKYADPKPSNQVKEMLKKHAAKGFLNRGFLQDTDGNFIIDSDGNKIDTTN